jgi:hypothetical protein
VPIQLSLAILISQIIEIGLDETLPPGSARDWSSLPDVTSLKEMDDLFLNEARTTFIGKGDRQKVATMFRELAGKVIDLEYDSLHSVEYSYHCQVHWACGQCCLITAVAIMCTVVSSLPWMNIEIPIEIQNQTHKNFSLPPTMSPTPSAPSPLTIPARHFLYFQVPAMIFGLNILFTFLYLTHSPTYRARWYRCLTRALCCKGLGNGPDPADLKRSVIYPRHTRRGPQTRTAGKLAVNPGKVLRVRA